MRPPLSVYVGGLSTRDEIARVKKMTSALHGLKAEVTSTWWQHVEAAGGSNMPHFTHTDQYAYSYSDLAEVDAATWLLVLMPPPGLVSAGAFFEFGYALGTRKKICVAGRGQSASIFTSMAQVRCETDEDAIEFFRKIA